MNQKHLEAKAAVVTKIAEEVKKTQSLVIAEYRGLSVSEMTNLRRQLVKENAHLSIYKNSLVERAMDKLGYKDDLASMLIGPNAYIFSNDLTSGPRVAAKFARKNNKLIVKGGIVEGKCVDAARMKVIATLPGREGLISMILSCLQAPMRGLAYALKSIADQKN